MQAHLLSLHPACLYLAPRRRYYRDLRDHCLRRRLHHPRQQLGRSADQSPGPQPQVLLISW